MKKLAPGRLVLATHNAGKVREIAKLVRPYGVEPVSAGDLGLPVPDEDGTTFHENALKKARAAAAATGLPALSDDSGIELPALGGRPGIFSADWAERQPFEGPPGRDWYLAMGKVEGLLAELGPAADRRARFVCTLALVWPDGAELVVDGEVRGHYVWPPRGTQGFGFDPAFRREGDEQTFGEIENDAKQAISHRADAFAKLVAAIF